MPEPRPPFRFGVVILAAGGSTRLGRPKQLLPYWGKTLVEHAARTALASGADEVVVSRAFQKSHMAAVRDPVGQTISLDGRVHTVIGVMPEDFDFPLGTELWVPLAFSPEGKARRDVAELSVIGRLGFRFEGIADSNKVGQWSKQVPIIPNVTTRYTVISRDPRNQAPIDRLKTNAQVRGRCCAFSVVVAFDADHIVGENASAPFELSQMFYGCRVGRQET